VDADDVTINYASLCIKWNI